MSTTLQKELFWIRPVNVNGLFFIFDSRQLTPFNSPVNLMYDCTVELVLPLQNMLFHGHRSRSFRHLGVKRDYPLPVLLEIDIAGLINENHGP